MLIKRYLNEEDKGLYHMCTIPLLAHTTSYILTNFFIAFIASLYFFTIMSNHIDIILRLVINLFLIYRIKRLNTAVCNCNILYLCMVLLIKSFIGFVLRLYVELALALASIIVFFISDF